jgi:hypothetical protein
MTVAGTASSLWPILCERKHAFPGFLQTKTAIGVRKILIDMSRVKDLRIRNA